jgi:hypothetical protein
MIPLRVFLKRQRYKVAIAAVLSTLSVAVAPEHSGLAQDHIGEALSMCLAVVEGAAFLLAAGLAVKVPRRSRSTPDPVADSRAGRLRARAIGAVAACRPVVASGLPSLIAGLARDR